MNSSGDIIEIDGDPYLICQIDTNQITICSLESGNRWRKSEPVECSDSITPEEMIEILGGTMDYGYKTIRKANES